MSRPSYANSSALRAAAEIATTPQNNRDVARALDAASRSIEAQCSGRVFYPITATRTLDWPDRASVNVDSKLLWLDNDELISITTLTVAGTATTAYRLGGNEPTGGPYRFIEINDTSAVSFSGGTQGHQDAVSIEGVFGWSDDTATAGALDGAVSTTTETTVNVTDGSAIDQGDLITIGTEKLVVTARGWVDTTEDLLAALDLEDGAATVAVADGTAYTAGETLLVDTERLIIVDIAGNNLTVTRGQEGTLIAAHSIGADIYAARALTVERGAVGTTAATHLDAAAVARQVFPSLLISLCLAEALVELAQMNAAYAREIGSGDNTRESSGKGLAQARRQFVDTYAPAGAVFAAGGSQ